MDSPTNSDEYNYDSEESAPASAAEEESSRSSVTPPEAISNKELLQLSTKMDKNIANYLYDWVIHNKGTIGGSAALAMELTRQNENKYIGWIPNDIDIYFKVDHSIYHDPVNWNNIQFSNKVQKVIIDNFTAHFGCKNLCAYFSKGHHKFRDSLHESYGNTTRFLNEPPVEDTINMEISVSSFHPISNPFGWLNNKNAYEVIEDIKVDNPNKLPNDLYTTDNILDDARRWNNYPQMYPQLELKKGTIVSTRQALSWPQRLVFVNSEERIDQAIRHRLGPDVPRNGPINSHTTSAELAEQYHSIMKPILVERAKAADAAKIAAQYTNTVLPEPDDSKPENGYGYTVVDVGIHNTKFGIVPNSHLKKIVRNRLPNVQLIFLYGNVSVPTYIDNYYDYSICKVYIDTEKRNKVRVGARIAHSGPGFGDRKLLGTISAQREDGKWEVRWDDDPGYRQAYAENTMRECLLDDAVASAEAGDAPIVRLHPDVVCSHCLDTPQNYRYSTLSGVIRTVTYRFIKYMGRGFIPIQIRDNILKLKKSNIATNWTQNINEYQIVDPIFQGFKDFLEELEFYFIQKIVSIENSKQPLKNKLYLYRIGRHLDILGSKKLGKNRLNPNIINGFFEGIIKLLEKNNMYSQNIGNIQNRLEEPMKKIAHDYFDRIENIYKIYNRHSQDDDGSGILLDMIQGDIRPARKTGKTRFYTLKDDMNTANPPITSFELGKQRWLAEQGIGNDEGNPNGDYIEQYAYAMINLVTRKTDEDMNTIKEIEEKLHSRKMKKIHNVLQNSFDESYNDARHLKDAARIKGVEELPDNISKFLGGKRRKQKLLKYLYN
ncbi:MAG: hypothetical protein CML47_11615 [Rhodobacteraceae bacterium]|uniref:Uncharacterized protein n=1 Tax=viral metagenome TaxID=1070528 RepID=A0A6C0AV75_9ZZZZ|nr:MAG: hypothetical protein CML47_11615 [Paracoccaceae bacterium]|tara:strand:- start:1141 stop:3630 length:2490 start_codon:yes stop_codon:yes gene_type:complete